jgi:hypothetical protein
MKIPPLVIVEMDLNLKLTVREFRERKKQKFLKKSPKA